MIPLNDKVVVALLRKESSSGLIMVNDPNGIVECSVLAIPHGESEIKIGDKVLVHMTNMGDVPGGKIVDRKNILGIIEE